MTYYLNKQKKYIIVNFAEQIQKLKKIFKRL